MLVCKTKNMAARLLFGKVLKIQPSSLSQCAVAATSIQTRRFLSSEMRKGTGGRSFLSGVMATMFRSTGLTGRYIANRLGRIGSRMIAPMLSDDKYLKTNMAEVPTGLPGLKDVKMTPTKVKDILRKYRDHLKSARGAGGMSLAALPMGITWGGDVAENWQLGLLESATGMMEELSGFHDEVMYVATVIMTLVMWVMVRAGMGRRYNRYLTEGTWLEVIWTIIPAGILIGIAFPSLRLLYLVDEVVDVGVTVKAIGHQWYWSYEYSDYGGEGIQYDSYMVPTSELKSGELRLLEVDNRLVLPIGTGIRVMVTGADVLHAFALPSMGVKVDAIPGRLNQVGMHIKRPGVYYGQCSELCGANHSFMPIVVEAVGVDRYVEWVVGGGNS